MADSYDEQIDQWEKENKVNDPPAADTENKADKGLIRFWYSERVNKQGDLRWKIDHRKMIQFVFALHYRRFDLNMDFFFVRVKNRIIEDVSITQIQDHVVRCLHTIKDEDRGGISRDDLLSLLFRSNSILFNPTKLSLLGPQKNMVINSDTKDHCFIYYDNGFVRCSKDGYDLCLYKSLDGYIYRKQVKPRKFFKKPPDEGNFRQFVFNISGKNEERFKALQTMLGYLMHGYFETKRKAINLTDSTISDNAEGRTGKTLLGMAISQIKSVCEISGKDFDPMNKHKYATASLDTQVVFLNDLRKNFKFEALFNDISDAITVDRKNLQPFQIKAKILISANDTFRIEGASAMDRVVEFELSDHYNISNTPAMEFNQWFFSSDWDEMEWLKFDNFMMQCICLYLKEGIITAPPINLDKRKQIQHTNIDFVEFMDEKICNGEIRRDFDYDKKELHEEFISKYPEYSADRWLKYSKNFVTYLKTYANHSPALKGYINERKSHGKALIRFSNQSISQQNTLF